MKNKRILVTGGGGFIGSHLVEELSKSGADVTAFIRYNSREDSGLLKFLPSCIYEKIKIIKGDLKDYNAVKAAASGKEIIFHLGAYIAIPYSYMHPREVIENNVMGTLNVLLAAKELGTKRIIHTSTSEVYGTARFLPITEEHPLQGQSPYSASKIAADKIAESFYCSYDLPVTIVRPFNTYGPRQSARAIIPTIITQALVLGKIRLGNIHTERDFTFVRDTVNGFIKAAESENTIGETVNLGTGVKVTIEDVSKIIFKKIGKLPEIEIDQERVRPGKSEVTCLQASCEKIKNIAGWTPETDIETGLKITIDWISENIGIYRPGKYTI